MNTTKLQELKKISKDNLTSLKSVRATLNRTLRKNKQGEWPLPEEELEVIKIKLEAVKEMTKEKELWYSLTTNQWLTRRNKQKKTKNLFTQKKGTTKMRIPKMKLFISEFMNEEERAAVLAYNKEVDEWNKKEEEQYHCVEIELPLTDEQVEREAEQSYIDNGTDNDLSYHDFVDAYIEENFTETNDGFFVRKDQ